MTKNRDPDPHPLGRWPEHERRRKPDRRHHHHDHDHGNPAVEQKLASILSLLTEGFRKMAQELDTLKAAVARNTDVENSAVTLLQGLKSKLDAAIAAGDPAALTALSTELGSSADALAAAVIANTPAA